MNYHHRVCAVGNEAQLRLMLNTMLRNAALVEDEDEEEAAVAQPRLQ